MKYDGVVEWYPRGTPIRATPSELFFSKNELVEFSSDEEWAEPELKAPVTKKTRPKKNSVCLAPGLKALTTKKMEQNQPVTKKRKNNQPSVLLSPELKAPTAKKRKQNQPTTKKNQPAKKKRKQKNEPYFRLSPELIAITKKPILSFDHVIKAIQSYIKSNDLQNPDYETEIFCDDLLKKVTNGISKGTFCEILHYTRQHVLEKVNKSEHRSEEQDGSGDEKQDEVNDHKLMMIQRHQKEALIEDKNSIVESNHVPNITRN